MQAHNVVVVCLSARYPTLNCVVCVCVFDICIGLKLFGAFTSLAELHAATDSRLCSILNGHFPMLS